MKVMALNCCGKQLDLTQPQVMGILNITPDSFSDGGCYNSVTAALQRALQIVAEGAAIIDVGGESTRPGSSPISLQEELDRVIPVVAKLSQEISIPISIDTSKPEVMREAIQAGATMINDVLALQIPGALEVACAAKVPVCLMHRQVISHALLAEPIYKDVVQEVANFLAERARTCQVAGIPAEHIILDPGFGFDKNAEHNLQLLNRLEELQALGFPILVGLSRKATIGKVLGKTTSQRLFGSVACAVLAVSKKAALIRAHDVQATVEAIKMTQAVLQS